MPIRKASAVWEGTLKGGKGSMALGSGAFEGKYSFGSRFENEEGTNPEELIGAAHAGCFSMALAHALAEAGFEPKSIETASSVELEKGDEGFRITSIHLKTLASVPKIDGDKFQQFAEEAKHNCPVSRALAGVNISLEAELTG